MATNNFITNTASLKTTVADIRKLDAKKINAQTIFLDGENIRDIINNATPTVKHSQDTRETVTENDLWGQWVETTDDGTIIVHDDWLTNPNASDYDPWDRSITKVEDNKAYTGNIDDNGNISNLEFYANVQTNKIKDGDTFFYFCTKLTTFSSDLSNLTDGHDMFTYCDNLTSFSSNLSNLTDGYQMFYDCSNLTSVTADLPSLTNGNFMFYYTKISQFTSDLPSLTNGENMFTMCENLTTFSSDLTNLTDGKGMFYDCSNLTLFDSDLSSLTTAQ